MCFYCHKCLAVFTYCMFWSLICSTFVHILTRSFHKSRSWHSVSSGVKLLKHRTFLGWLCAYTWFPAIVFFTLKIVGMFICTHVIKKFYAKSEKWKLYRVCICYGDHYSYFMLENEFFWRWCKSVFNRFYRQHGLPGIVKVKEAYPYICVWNEEQF